MKELTGKKTLVLIVVLVILWGMSWPIYKIALEYTPPLLFAGMRTLFGGFLLALFLLPRRKYISWKENWHIYLISSVLNVILFYGLQTMGLMYIPSGLFSIVVYLQPVLVGIFAWLWLEEKMSLAKMGGLILGFLGVATVSQGGFSGELALIGIILAFFTGVSWALGTVYIKKVGKRLDPMWLTSIQCMIGGTLLTGVGSSLEDWSSIIWNVPYTFGLIYGSILGISVSWIIYFTLVKSGEASKIATYTFLVPLIAVISGTILLGEPFTINIIAGLLLIMVSIYIVNRKPRSLHQLKSAKKTA